MASKFDEHDEEQLTRALQNIPEDDADESWVKDLPEALLPDARDEQSTVAMNVQPPKRKRTL